jgi:hypothetical protein
LALALGLAFGLLCFVWVGWRHSLPSAQGQILAAPHFIWQIDFALMAVCDQGNETFPKMTAF